VGVTGVVVAREQGLMLSKAALEPVGNWDGMGHVSIPEWGSRMVSAL